MQIAFGWNCGNEGNVTLEGGGEDYALLNAERMVYISFLINAFKKCFFFVNACKMFLCIHIFYLLLSHFFGFSRLALVLRMWSVLVFRSTK